jgi:SulP family sulfate permease
MAAVTETRPFEPEPGHALGNVPKGVLVYDISGALFFGAAQKAMGLIQEVSARTHTVILRMDEVHAIDVSGLVALESAVEVLRGQHCLAVLVGLRIQPRGLLTRAGFGARTDVVLCDDLAEAFEIAGQRQEARPRATPVPA